MIARCIAVLLSAAVLGSTPGCGETPKTPDSLPMEEQFQDLGGLIQEYQDARKKAPTKVQDLTEFEPAHPRGYTLLSSGQAVYVWGVGISSGTSVLAHEKDAEQKGGCVLLQDGSVKTMSASEFAAAPKAKK